VAAAAAQAQAFENFISSTPCLNSQRGRIMERNSCRNPWINQIDVSFAQSLRALRYQNLQVRLDIINFGNLLNKNWGKTSFSIRTPPAGQICSATVVLTQTGNKLPGTLTSSQEATGVYTFDQKYKLFTSDFAGSNYQMQLSLRYSFLSPPLRANEGPGMDSGPFSRSGRTPELRWRPQGSAVTALDGPANGIQSNTTETPGDLPPLAATIK
jgi:hypothetical protein